MRRLSHKHQRLGLRDGSLTRHIKDWSIIDGSLTHAVLEKKMATVEKADINKLKEERPQDSWVLTDQSMNGEKEFKMCFNCISVWFRLRKLNTT
jgi:hypothetical protein